MNNRSQQLEAFNRLLDIMDDLREKCPWDKKQTFASLRHLSIEEIFELSDAINEENYEEIKKELGDVFLHLVFYSKLGSEINQFDVADVLNNLCDKLIYRHPHIYGEVKAETEEEVLRNWEELKLKEKNTQEERKSVLGGVPKSLPAMIKALRIQHKVKGVGFEFENEQQVWDKIMEEIEEFKAETDPQKQEEELGDIFFSLINYARFIGLDPEDALEKTNKKFIKRFKVLEEITYSKNLSISNLTIEESDKLWEEAKQMNR